MPYTPEEKKKAISRLRRIKGQADALIRAIEGGADCADLLQQIAAVRGATNSLVAEVFASYLRTTFGNSGDSSNLRQPDETEADIEAVLKILRTYMK